MKSINSNYNATSGYHFCELLFELGLPSFYSNVKYQGYSGLNDFFLARNAEQHQQTSGPDCSFLVDDFAHFFNLCSMLESNLVYLEWIFSLVKPLVFTFMILIIGPCSVVLSAFAFSFFCFYMKHLRSLRTSISNSNWWEASAKAIAVFWEWHGAIFHSHEIVGLSHLPERGGALLIYYHAAMPIDYFYVYSKTMLYRNRRMKVVADKFLFKVPGLNTLLEVSSNFFLLFLLFC